jgi:ABC-type sulfate transport system permease subunit
VSSVRRLAFARGHTGDGVALLAMFAVLQVPRLLRLPLALEGFWGRYAWWDTLVHAALPAVLAPTALVLLIRVPANLLGGLAGALAVMGRALSRERSRRAAAAASPAGRA